MLAAAAAGHQTIHTHLHSVAQQQRLQVLHQLAVVAVVAVAARWVVPHHQLQRWGREGAAEAGVKWRARVGIRAVEQAGLFQQQWVAGASGSNAGLPAPLPASLPHLPVCGGGIQAVLQLQQLRLPALLRDAAGLDCPGCIPVPLNEGAAPRGARGIMGRGAGQSSDAECGSARQPAWQAGTAG